MTQYIYSVGKPYPQPEALTAIKKLGYKAGLFLDKNAKSNQTSQYDRVVEVDFTSLDSLHASMPSENLKVAGLICSYENYLTSKSWLGEYFGVYTPSLETSRMSTDKYLMRQAFMKHNPAITPNFAMASSEGEALEIARNLTYPLIIKPTNLVKSLLVMRCGTEDELRTNFAYASQHIAGLYQKYNIYDRQPGLIIEEFMTGKLYSAAAFVDQYGEPHFASGIASLINAQDTGVDDNYLYARHLPAQISESLEDEIIQAATDGIKALAMTSTPAHVELIHSPNGVRLIEIGARIGGYRPRMYSASYGIDLIEQEIALSVGKQSNLDGEFMSYSSVYELFPAKEGEFVELAEVSEDAKYSYFSTKAKPGQIIGPAKDGYKAAAVIIVNSSDMKTHQASCRSIDNIKVVTK